MTNSKAFLPYTHRFLNHLNAFIQNQNLFGKEDSLLIAVSGGMDSIGILHAISQLKSYGYSNSVRVITIDHGTRNEQQKETRLVKNFAFSLGYKTIIHKLEKNFSGKNFEAEARIERYKVFNQYLNPKEKLVLGHHIDDSFEWTLLQQLRSSSLKGQLGIPVRNKNIIRPFMCATRSQIENYVQENNLEYTEDPTNSDEHFERNFLRSQIIPLLAQRHPKYLKHYVYRQNQLANSLFLSNQQSAKSDLVFTQSGRSVLGYSFNLSENFNGLEEIILGELKRINPKVRGVTAVQLKKLKSAMLNQKKGPLTLSGGLKVYMDFNMLLLTGDEPSQLKSKSLGKLKLDEFKTILHGYLQDKEQALSFPFFVEVTSDNLDTRQFSTSFNTKGVSKLKKRRASYYPALRLLREWSKKRNRFKSLSLKLMLVKD